MLTYRIAGGVRAAFGLALLVAQLPLLYGSVAQQALMVSIGLPGTAALSAVGAVWFSMECLLAAAPRTTVHHARRIASAALPPGG
jgi:hypothetical protein